MSSDLCWAFVERHSERFLAGRKAAGAGTRDRPVTGFFWKLIRSCRLDPDLLQAHVWLARVSAGRVAYGWSDTEDADLREGIDAVVRAIHIDEKSPYAHYALAITSVYASEFDQAIRAAGRAVELNPSFALAYLVLGMACLFSGDAVGAIEPLEHGLRLNPHDPAEFRLVQHAGLCTLLCRPRRQGSRMRRTCLKDSSGLAARDGNRSVLLYGRFSDARCSCAEPASRLWTSSTTIMRGATLCSKVSAVCSTAASRSPGR
jgi:tetratricopeptide (TPR) repeat protein